MLWRVDAGVGGRATAVLVGNWVRSVRFWGLRGSGIRTIADREEWKQAVRLKSGCEMYG